MNREFLNEVLNLFDTPEKWSSFIELHSKKDQIRDSYFTKAQTVLNKRFRQIDIEEKWEYFCHNNIHYKWYLKDFGFDSICIFFDLNRGNLYLWANGHCVDIEKARGLLKTEHFASLFNLIERIDEIGIEGRWELMTESGNFYFESSYDGNFTGDKLAWYAGNRSEKFVEQISEKINRLRKNPELTNLLRELNEVCKIKND